MLDHAYSPTRTTRRPAFCMRSKSASHRDSGHCSGYHEAPRSGPWGVLAWAGSLGTPHATAAHAARTRVSCLLFFILRLALCHAGPAFPVIRKDGARDIHPGAENGRGEPESRELAHRRG